MKKKPENKNKKMSTTEAKIRLEEIEKRIKQKYGSVEALINNTKEIIKRK